MKMAYIFPGQGAQYPGMCKDFVEAYSVARNIFEEADDILGRRLSSIILTGPETLLTETQNSQVGIYLTSFAILSVIQKLFPDLKPDYCAGLSLGEYTAATAAGYLSFKDCLPLVEYRGQYMNEACQKTAGSMAVILGLDPLIAEEIVKIINLPNDLWVANYNCPGQVVISGTLKGIERGAELARKKGAKRVLPLKVHGAFHSGLMQSARDKLQEHVLDVPFGKPRAKLVMNVTGNIEDKEKSIRSNLIEQVTSPVRWESGIRKMDQEGGVELYIEIGPGQSLAGFNKRIGVKGNTISIEKIEDLHKLEQALLYWGK